MTWIAERERLVEGESEQHRPPRLLGIAVLGLSASGFPLTQLVISRYGRRGAILVELVCTGLLLRDALMIGSGAPRRLRTAPAALLWCELAAAGVAVATGLPLLFERRRWEMARRSAIGLLFGLHTLRFGIYLSPDRGLRPTQPA